MPIKTETIEISHIYSRYYTRYSNIYTRIAYYDDHSIRSEAGEVLYDRKPEDGIYDDFIIFYKNDNNHQKIFLKDNKDNIKLPKPGRVLTNLTKMTDDLITALKTGPDAGEKKPDFVNRIKSLLNRKHIIHIYESDITYPDNDSEIEIEYQRYQYRPFLEALFFENIAAFNLLVTEICKASHPAICEQFIEILKDSDLRHPALTRFNEKNKTDLLNAITELNNYATVLLQNTDPKAIERGHQAKELATTLSADVARAPLTISENDPIGQMNTLQFKLGILEKLHKYDKQFEPHRGWKKFLANAANILCSILLVNVGYYLWTGHAMFSNKNTTQTKIDNVQAKLGVVTGEMVHYMKKPS